MVLVNILWPTFVLVALIFVVWFTMVWQRLGHIKRTPPGSGDLATREAMIRYFQPVAQPSDNYVNLFEMPVLYFALVALLLITGHAGYAQVALAWVYVLLRIAHSAIHLGPNNLQPRFLAYLGSTIVLSAMWIGFFVDMVIAAQAYHAAMAAMQPM